MADIICADPRHALRSALPGWRTVLGQSDRPVTCVCAACARVRLNESTNNTDKAWLHIVADGSIEIGVPREYDDGSVVSVRTFRGRASELSDEDRAVVQDAIQRLKAALIT